jgi:3-hydroxy acid dehydrogenase/malonic semialdehyde reductase
MASVNAFANELISLARSPQPESLVGKSVLVTGVTAGIGAATAVQLVQRGAVVFGTGRRKDRLDVLASFCAGLSEKGPGRLVPLVADARAGESLRSLETAGALEVDACVANAGLARGVAPVAELEAADAAEMIDTNVTATFALVRQILPHMIRRNKGQIVGVGSIAAHQPYANGNVYCATKAAVRAFFQCLRQETCGQNIRVNLVSPGLVETDFSRVRFRGDDERARSVYQGLTPLTAQDIASLIVHILELPWHVNIDDVIVTPIRQGSVYRIARE